MKESDLYDHAHRLIWDAVWSLVESGAEPDLATVYQTLRCRNQLRELCPMNAALWLAELYEADPTGAWAEWACRVVKYHANRRALIQRAKMLERDVYAGVLSPEDCAMQLG